MLILQPRTLCCLPIPRAMVALNLKVGNATGSFVATFLLVVLPVSRYYFIWLSQFPTNKPSRFTARIDIDVRCITETADPFCWADIDGGRLFPRPDRSRRPWRRDKVRWGGESGVHFHSEPPSGHTDGEGRGERVGDSSLLARGPAGRSPGRQ